MYCAWEMAVECCNIAQNVAVSCSSSCNLARKYYVVALGGWECLLSSEERSKETPHPRAGPQGFAFFRGHSSPQDTGLQSKPIISNWFD